MSADEDWDDAFVLAPARVDSEARARAEGRDVISDLIRTGIPEGDNLLGQRAQRAVRVQRSQVDDEIRRELARNHHLDWDLIDQDEMDYDAMPVYQEDLDPDDDDSILVTFSVDGNSQFPLSSEAVSTMLNDLAVNTVALGGTVYVLDNGVPLTAAMVQLIVSMNGAEAWHQLKQRALSVRSRKNILPAFNPVALAELNQQSTPSYGQIVKAFQGWNVETLLHPVLIPTEVMSTSRYVSLYGGAREFTFESPLWILTTDPVPGTEYKLYMPKPVVRLFTKPADVGVLNIAQSLARAGTTSQVRLYKDLLDVASHNVYTTGTLNGLLGRLRKTMDLDAATAKEPFGYSGKWRRGAVGMSFTEYKQRMLVVAPMGKVPPWAAVGPSAAKNIEYATGVNLNTGLQVEPAVGAALFHVSLGSAAGLLAPKKAKRDTFMADVLTAGHLLKFFCTPDATREELAQMDPLKAERTLKLEKERAARREVVANHLSLCEAKRKVETTTMEKAGLLVTGKGYGPRFAPGAKARLYYPIPSVLDMWAAFYLTYIFKFVHPVDGGHKLSYVTPLNSKTSISLIGWSFFHGGLHELIEVFHRRGLGSVVYSDNLTPFRKDTDGWLQVGGLDVSSMEAAIRRRDAILFLGYLYEVQWGGSFDMKEGADDFTFGPSPYIDSRIFEYLAKWYVNMVIDSPATLGGVQFRLPGDKSGVRWTAYMNSAKLLMCQSVWATKNNGAEKFPLVGEDKEEWAMSKDYEMHLRHFGMQMTVETCVQLPPMEDMEECADEQYRVDILGMDARIVYLPGLEEYRYFAVLQRERRLKSIAMTKTSYKSEVKAVEGKTNLSSQNSAHLITILKSASIYLMGGWVDPAEAALLQAQISSARAAITTAVGGVTALDLVGIVARFMADVGGDADAEPDESAVTAFGPMVPILRTLGVPTYYDVVCLNTTKEAADLWYATMLQGEVDKGAMTPEEVLVFAVKLGGLSNALSFRWPAAYAEPFSGVLSGSLDVTKAGTMTTAQRDAVASLANFLGAGLEIEGETWRQRKAGHLTVFEDAQGEESYAVEGEVVASPEAVAATTRRAAAVKQGAVAGPKERKVKPTTQGAAKTQPATGDPFKGEEGLYVTSEATWKALTSKERVSMNKTARIQLKTLHDTITALQEASKLPPGPTPLSRMVVTGSGKTDTPQYDVAVKHLMMVLSQAIAAANIKEGSLNLQAYLHSWRKDTNHLPFGRNTITGSPEQVTIHNRSMVDFVTELRRLMTKRDVDS